MDLSGVVWAVLAVGFVVVFLAVMLPLVVLANRAIGSRYDERAALIAPRLAAEGLRFVEDDVRIRAGWVAPLAVGVRWTRADVRVTTRAIYLVQNTRMFGARMGQPILAFALRGAEID